MGRRLLTDADIEKRAFWKDVLWIPPDADDDAEGTVIEDARDPFWTDGCWAWMRYPVRSLVLSGRKVSISRYLIEVFRPEFYAVLSPYDRLVLADGCRKECVNPWHRGLALKDGSGTVISEHGKVIDFRKDRHKESGRTIGELADRAYLDAMQSIAEFRKYVINGEVVNFGPKWIARMYKDERIRQELAKLFLEKPSVADVKMRVDSYVAERNERILYRIDESEIFPDAEPLTDKEAMEQVMELEKLGRELESR